MKINNEISYDFDDVLIRPQRSTINSRSDVKLEREFKFYHSNKIWVGIPVVCSNMRCVGTITMAKTLQKYKMITCLHKFYKKKDLADKFTSGELDPNYVFITIGENEDLSEIPKQCNILIDAANGHRETFVEWCKNVRTHFPDSIIMAGNVCIPEMVQELTIHGGVDIVKIQIGPGKACKTRKVTGVGYGSLSCSSECSSSAHGLKNGERKMGLVCSDGGCKEYGDICKSLCSGSDFVMLGSIFSGTDECDESEWISKPTTDYDEKLNLYWSGPDKKVSMKFYGESSYHAQKLNNDVKDYRASEGEVFEVPYKGPVSGIINEMLGGIRSCCTYIGATSIKDMSKCGQFVRVSKIHQNI